MPTYEYVCEACGHEWEAFQSMKDKPLTVCAKCQAPRAKRQVSAGVGFILKGGGWYADLYASSKKASSGGTDTTTSDAKPAKKTGGGTSDAGGKSDAGSGGKADGGGTKTEGKATTSSAG